MSKDFNSNTKNHDEWLTPPEIVEALGPFDLDPCSPIVRPWPTADHHYGEKLRKRRYSKMTDKDLKVLQVKESRKAYFTRAEIDIARELGGRLGRFFRKSASTDV